MNDEKIQDLAALTDQPIEIKLGDFSYKARRISLYDYCLWKEFIEAKKKAGEEINLEFRQTAYLITLAINDFLEKPLTYEDVLKKVALGEDGLTQLSDILNKLGFKKLQPKTEAMPETPAV
jgi:hypothetical protein